MTVVIIMILVSFTYLLYKDFRFGVTVLCALLPTYLIRFSLGPIPTTLLELLLVTTIVFWLVQKKGYRLDFLRSMGPYRVPMLLLLSAACFGVAAAPDTFAALGIWKAYYLEPIAFFFVLRTTFETREDGERALTALFGSAVFLAIIAVMQWGTGMGIPVPWDSERRVTSVFEYPNALGLFVAPIVSAGVVLATCQTTPVRTRVIAGAAAALSLLAALLSKTEAALVAIPLALVFALLLSTAPRKLKIGLTSAVFTLGACLLIFSPVIREKLLLQDFSGEARRLQWSETIVFLKDHPIFGAGLSGYPSAIAPYHDPRIFEIFQYPHNILLNFWVELGILGVIALLFFVIATWRIAAMRRGDTLVLAAGAALLTMVIHGIVDVPFFKNDLAILTVFFLALMLAKGKAMPEGSH